MEEEETEESLILFWKYNYTKKPTIDNGSCNQETTKIVIALNQSHSTTIWFDLY